MLIIIKHIHRQQGFTLIEMLVVMLLTAILAAVAVPLYTSYNKNIRTQEGQAAALNVLTAAKVYYYRNGESGFTGSYCDCTQSPTNNFWLNTGEICNRWKILYEPSGKTVKITVTNKSDASIAVPVIFDASLGSTNINGRQG